METRRPTDHVEGRSVSRRTYETHGCRCVGCTEAKAASQVAYREWRRARGKPVTFRDPMEVRDAIECAIARDEPMSAIMALGYDYETVARIRDRMNKLAAA